jgi:hypothetical protein
MNKKSTHEQDLEEMNLGVENTSKKVYIGKRINLMVREMLITLLRKYKNVFTWSYDDLKAYREYLFQHEIPLNPNAKPFKQRKKKKILANTPLGCQIWDQ